MRHFLQIISFAALFSTGFAAAAPVASSITAVTVYTDRAIVTRSASVELAAGPAEIVFDHLPVGLLDQSLQAAGRGLAGATILDVTVGRSFVDYTPNQRVQALEDDLQALQGDVRRLNDRAATLARQRDFVDKMIAASTGSAEKRPALDEWKQLFDYAGQTFGKLAEELQALDLQKAALELRRTALERQKTDLRGAGGRAFKTVTVRLSAATAGMLELALNYSIGGASWSPAYDARLRTEDRAIDLTYFGVVRQNTGEDWSQVALTLSTAQPALGGGAPAPRPWYLSPVELERFKMAEKALAAASTAMVPPMLRETANLDSSATASQAQLALPAATLAVAAVNPSLTSATFKVALPVSLAADNNPQKFAVTTARLAAAMQYEATPKLIEAAFLVATTMNRTAFPFLAGSLSTFLDETFVATSALRTVMPGEKFDLAFGADDGIAIKRKALNRFTEDTGLTGRGERVTYDAVVTVTNHKKTAEKLTFREAIPVSRDEKVVVRALAPAERDLGTPDKPRDVTRENDGILAWKFTLQPGEKREIPIRFSVEHPAEITIAGLE